MRSTIEQGGLRDQFLLDALSQGTTAGGMHATMWITEVEGCESIRTITGRAVDMNGDHEIGLDSVGEVRAIMFILQC